jgi:hypothetical protein
MKRLNTLYSSLAILTLLASCDLVSMMSSSGRQTLSTADTSNAPVVSGNVIDDDNSAHIGVPPVTGTQSGSVAFDNDGECYLSMNITAPTGGTVHKFLKS